MHELPNESIGEKIFGAFADHWPYAGIIGTIVAAVAAAIL